MTTRNRMKYGVPCHGITVRDWMQWRIAIIGIAAIQSFVGISSQCYSLPLERFNCECNAYNIIFSLLFVLFVGFGSRIFRSFAFSGPFERSVRCGFQRSRWMGHVRRMCAQNELIHGTAHKEIEEWNDVKCKSKSRTEMNCKQSLFVFDGMIFAVHK